MTFKLDKKDQLLLALLDENSRYSNTQLAKKIKLSKTAIEYRLQRFEKNEIIFANYAVVNFTKLGLSQYKIYFKFQNTTPKEEQEIISCWKKKQGVIWLGSLRGRWDLTISILAKSNYELGLILSEFMNQYSQKILEKDILLTEYSPLFARTYLSDNAQEEFFYGKPTEIIALDEIDKLIIKELATNARISIIDLSNKTKLTRDIINYRLKKLQKDQVIAGFRCFPNLEYIGIKLYKLMIRAKNLNQEAEQKLKTYLSYHKKAQQMIKLIGSWDLEIEFETESEDEFYEHISDLRKEFSENIKDFDILRITKTHKYNYFPF